MEIVLLMETTSKVAMVKRKIQSPQFELRHPVFYFMNGCLSHLTIFWLLNCSEFMHINYWVYLRMVNVFVWIIMKDIFKEKKRGNCKIMLVLPNQFWRLSQIPTYNTLMPIVEDT